jgi:hypothetical protein
VVAVAVSTDELLEKDPLAVPAVILNVTWTFPTPLPPASVTIACNGFVKAAESAVDCGELCGGPA